MGWVSAAGTCGLGKEGRVKVRGRVEVRARGRVRLGVQGPLMWFQCSGLQTQTYLSVVSNKMEDQQRRRGKMEAENNNYGYIEKGEEVGGNS